VILFPRLAVRAREERYRIGCRRRVKDSCQRRVFRYAQAGRRMRLPSRR
jgi:hypothetical protein